MTGAPATQPSLHKRVLSIGDGAHKRIQSFGDGALQAVMEGLTGVVENAQTTIENVQKMIFKPTPAPPAEEQLLQALQAFAYAWNLPDDWAAKYYAYFLQAGITSMNDLQMGCKEDTVNFDLEFSGALASPEEKLPPGIVSKLHSFLPGHQGFRCFRMALATANKVEEGRAHARYVHRPESGNSGEERFSVKNYDNDAMWKIHVDCAGFVRSVLKHVTKDPFSLSLSDRSFMRAKDFYRFFETLDYTVLDHQDDLEDDDKRMHWRLIHDLRMVIPGDIIVYRPKGNAAGGAAFTQNDRTDLKHLLKAVKTAVIWKQESVGNALVTRNAARDESVKPFVEDMTKELATIGITTVKELRANFDQTKQLVDKGVIDEDTIALMKECSETIALNTGHIVFASGPALLKGENEWRIKVVHSTKHGKTDPKSGEETEGVQEYYRRFQLVDGKWTRQMLKANDLDEEQNGGRDSNDDDDLDEDDPEDEDNNQSDTMPEDAGGDELAGLADVEVLAARMCF